MADAKRVYILGAGVSKELGAPVIKDFLEKLLHMVPESRTRWLRQFLSRRRKNMNVEQVLSEVEEHILKGRNLAGYDVPFLRKIRNEIVNGIVDTLLPIHFEFLRSHYSYQRQYDPYYYEARDFEALKRVRSKFVNAIERERARLVEAKSLRDVSYVLFIEPIAELFSSHITDPQVFYLVIAALAGGYSRLQEWFCDLWPFYVYKDEGLDKHDKREYFDRFIRILQDQAAAKIKAVSSWTKTEFQEFLSQCRENPKIANQYFEECALAMKEAVYPVLLKNTEWLKQQADYLLKGSQDRTNPYILLAGLSKQSDTFITLNYDLFLECAFEMLRNSGVDYRLRELIAITPWGREPFENHGNHGALLEFVEGETPSLLKLHGSVNWLQCPFCKMVYYTVNSPASSSASRHVLRELMKFSWQQYGSYPCCHFFRAEKVEVPIVPPGLKKSLHFSSLAPAWDIARRKLALTDEVVLIGYGLSRSDEDVRHLILDAVELRISGKADWIEARTVRKDEVALKEWVPPSKRALIVKVVNPCSKAQERYRKFFANITNVKLEEPISSTGSDYLRRELLRTRPEELSKFQSV